VLYLALVGLLALGVAAAVRHPAAATGVVLGLLYLFPIMAQAVSDERWQKHLLRIGPMTAGLAIQATTNLNELPIAPWKGLGVLSAWAAGALLIGGLLLRYRDA
jgi:ABC-2 type transport system permease protein